MNNNNYLGSSLLIINLDFSYIPQTNSKMNEQKQSITNTINSGSPNKDTEKEKSRANLPAVTRKLSQNFPINTQRIIKNQLGIVKDLDLPPIK